MLRSFLLFLPVLVPSWRFFDGIAPSPRIEYAVSEEGENWKELWPTPEYVSPKTMFQRLFWNPDWNEKLFLVSCAERLMDAPSDHSHNEILRRVREEVSAGTKQGQIRFRLVFVSRDGETLRRDITYVSPVHSITP